MKKVKLGIALAGLTLLGFSACAVDKTSEEYEWPETPYSQPASSSSDYQEPVTMPSSSSSYEQSSSSEKVAPVVNPVDPNGAYYRGMKMNVIQDPVYITRKWTDGGYGNAENFYVDTVEITKGYVIENDPLFKNNNSTSRLIVPTANKDTLHLLYLKDDLYSISDPCSKVGVPIGVKPYFDFPNTLLTGVNIPSPEPCLGDFY
jgi:hypothetical protein